MLLLINTVHFPCNCITYIKFNARLLHNVFYLLINAPTFFCLSRWPSSGSSLKMVNV